MQQAQQTKVNTKDLVETALLIALVYIATRFINIRLPIAASGGLVHFGIQCYLSQQSYLDLKKEQQQGHLEWAYLIYYQNGQCGPHLHL